jgi:hypothetical protein
MIRPSVRTLTTRDLVRQVTVIFGIVLVWQGFWTVIEHCQSHVNPGRRWQVALVSAFVGVALIAVLNPDEFHPHTMLTS